MEKFGGNIMAACSGILSKKLLYDDTSTEAVNDARIICGQPNGIANFSKPTHKWALNLYDHMLANTWFPQEVSMQEDKREYNHLTPDEKRMYDLVLAQLIYMDSLQSDNLADNINPYITDKIVNCCLVRQAFEESLHSRSYAVMAEDISENTDSIYELWREDHELNKKNKYIAKVYQELAGDVTPEKIILAMVANQCLEGIYFITGFAAFYALGHKMKNSAGMISFIHRDEKTHLTLFQNIFKETRRQNPELFTPELLERAVEMVREAVELEVAWGEYVTQESILGMTPPVIADYVKTLGNERLKALGLDPIFETTGVGSFLKKLEERYGQHNDTRSNFFESTPRNYSKGTLDFDF
jgi:ribonucleoside-diphosphate reductase beta chain